MIEVDSILPLLILFSLVAVLIGFVWWIIRDTIPFLYPTGVLMAREARLIDDSKFEELILLPLEDFVSFLQDTECGEYIGRVVGESSAIESGLFLFKMDEYYKLFKLIPERFSDIFEFLVREWDVMNLRAVLTGVHAGLHVDEIRNRLIEGGEMFEKIVNVAGEDLEMMASTFEGTPLADAIEEYNRIKDFSGIDLALGKWMLEDISRKLDGRVEKKLWMVRRYLEIYVDGLNLKTMFRGKESSVTEGEIERFLIGADAEAVVTRVYEETGSVREFLERLRETRYGYLIAEVEGDDDVMRIERRIDEAVLRKVKNLSSEEVFGFGPILRFLVMKDAEIRNLRVIAKLKVEGVPSGRIKEIMVRVGKGS